MKHPVFISDQGSFSTPEELVRSLIAQKPAKPLPEVPKAKYLDLAEHIVRTGSAWQDQTTGEIIDPYEHRETPTVTARYIGALGALMQQGRCLDLMDTAVKAMEPVMAQLLGAQTSYGEFLVKESLMTYIALQDKVDPALIKRWHDMYASYDPEVTYGRTRTRLPDLEQRQNYITFALAGEAMKKHLGIVDHRDFVYSYLDEQFERFDELGMYRDPHAPIVYDITPRMNLELAQYFTTYEEPYGSKLSGILRNGAMCSLLYQSSLGEMPFGGRSNQQNFVEASFAIICELEARKFKAMGDIYMAGVFRRAAARAVNSIESYLLQTPVNFNKNRFPAAAQHGRQRDYGFYGAYTLLIASQLAIASLVADDSIPFADVTPSECGTYLWTTTDTFHKVFAYINGSHIEIELKPNRGYDAVGWGRWHIAGFPSELVLSTPVTAHPSLILVIKPQEALAIGPGCAEDGCFVADMIIEDPSECCFRDPVVNSDYVEFAVDWPSKVGKISEKIRLTEKSASVEACSNCSSPISYRVPMIMTNGDTWGVSRATENGFDVEYRNCRFSITSDAAEKIEERWVAGNRNALYKTARFNSATNSVKVDLKVEKC